MKIKMLLLDPDASYIVALQNFIEEHYPTVFLCHGFTSIEELRIHQDTLPARMDLALMSQNLLEDLLYHAHWKEILGEALLIKIDEEQLDAKSRLFQSMDFRKDQDTPTCAMDSRYPVFDAISKYLPGDILIKRILSLYTHRLGTTNIPFRRYGCNLYLCCSPQGGVGISTISYLLALESAKSGFKTLWLNLSGNSSVEHFISPKALLTMEDIFFYLKSDSKNLGIQIEAAIQKEPESNLQYITAGENMAEIYDIAGKEYYRFLKILMQLELVDSVYVDMPHVITANFIPFLEKASRIYLVAQNNSVSKMKMVHFVKYLFRLAARENLSIQDKVCGLFNQTNLENTDSSLLSFNTQEESELKKIPWIALPFEKNDVWSGQSRNAKKDSQLRQAICHLHRQQKLENCEDRS